MLKETLSNMFNIQSRTVNNAIIQLGDTDDSGKGKHFKSRFVQPGIAGYPERDENLLITKESFDRFIHTLKNKPVIINHKDEITDDDKVGEVHNVWYNPEDGWYWCDGIITDKYAMDLIKKHKWSVSCSYDILKADDEGGSENNIKYGMEILDGEFKHLAIVKNPRYERANIVFNSKTQIVNGNPDQPRVPKGNPNGGQFAPKNKYINGSKSPIANFYDIHRNYAELAPEEYKGKPTFNAVLAHLGSTDNNSAKIKTPLSEIIFNRNNLHHLIIDHPERLPDLNKMIKTLQAPNLIVSGSRDGKNYNYYIKNFKEKNENKGQFEVVKIAPDGDFYTSSYTLSSNKFKQIINEGQIIFDLTSDSTAIQKNVSVNNIIPPPDTNLNPNVKNNKQTFEEAFTDVFFEALAEVLLETYK